MHRPRALYRLFACMAPIVFGSLDCLASANTWTITDLGTVAGAGDTMATAVNNSRQVVGHGIVGITHRAFIWDDGHIRNLGTDPDGTALPAGFRADIDLRASFAFDINDAGVVVGRGCCFPTVLKLSHRAEQWIRGEWRQLLADRVTEKASGINRAGHVVGTLLIDDGTPQGTSRGFYLHDGELTEIGTFGGDGSAANDINDLNQVVGNADPPGSDGMKSHPFLWHDGSLRDLGTLGGDYGTAKAINNSEIVVGQSQNSAGRHQAFRWERGRMVTLPVPPAATQSYAAALNDSGIIVGGTLPAETARALMWTSRGVVDLNDVVPVESKWKLQAALGINDRGDIVGHGKHNGKSRAFLLSPAP